MRFTVDRGMPLTDDDAARQLKQLAKLGTEKAIADIRKTMDEHPLERAKKGKGAKAETTTPTDESAGSAEDTAKTTKGKKAKNSKESKAKKMSALDAAAKVLEEKSEAMNCQEMIDAMKSSKYWISSNGLTPQATLYSAITREIKTKGDKARFKKTVM